MLIFPASEREICIDEAGRGCLMGPVCAAAVVMPQCYDDSDEYVHQIKDSKKLSAKKRTILAEYIKEIAIDFSVGLASHQEIDEMNILNATYLAMHRAVDQIKDKTGRILVDGPMFKPYFDKETGDWTDYECFVNGDNIHLGIAAASILAKTHRDSLIDSMVLENPIWKEEYKFHTNKGYGTQAHIVGIKKYGRLECHRKSFMKNIF